MYNAGKIIPGLVIFAVVLTFPLWYNVILGKADYVPDIKVPTTATKCVEPEEIMRDNHMVLLDDWRQQAVREGKTTYIANDGETYEIDMESTCFECHTNTQEFCTQCHEYAGVNPNCWSCHNLPEGE